MWGCPGFPLLLVSYSSWKTTECWPGCACHGRRPEGCDRLVAGVLWPAQVQCNPDLDLHTLLYPETLNRARSPPSVRYPPGPRAEAAAARQRPARLPAVQVHGGGQRLLQGGVGGQGVGAAAISPRWGWGAGYRGCSDFSKVGLGGRVWGLQRFLHWGQPQRGQLARNGNFTWSPRWWWSCGRCRAVGWGGGPMAPGQSGHCSARRSRRALSYPKEKLPAVFRSGAS